MKKQRSRPRQGEGCAAFTVKSRSGELAEGENADSGHVSAQLLRQSRRDSGDQLLTVGGVLCRRDHGGRGGLDRGGGAAPGADDLAHDHGQQDQADQAEKGNAHTHKADKQIRYFRHFLDNLPYVADFILYLILFILKT